MVAGTGPTDGEWEGGGQSWVAREPETPASFVGGMVDDPRFAYVWQLRWHTSDIALFASARS